MSTNILEVPADAALTSLFYAIPEDEHEDEPGQEQITDYTPDHAAAGLPLTLGIGDGQTIAWITGTPEQLNNIISAAHAGITELTQQLAAAAPASAPGRDNR